MDRPEEEAGGATFAPAPGQGPPPGVEPLRLVAAPPDAMWNKLGRAVWQARRDALAERGTVGFGPGRWAELPEEEQALERRVAKAAVVRFLTWGIALSDLADAERKLLVDLAERIDFHEAAPSR